MQKKLISFLIVMAMIVGFAVVPVMHGLSAQSRLVHSVKAANLNHPLNDTYENPTISSFGNYYAHTVADGKPLFRNDTQGGGINVDVAQEITELLDAVNPERREEWPSGNNRIVIDQFYERNAEDFSEWVLEHYNVDPEEWDINGGTKSGGVYVKLFDCTDLDSDVFVNSLASQWFQIVYTSNDEGNEPILTLYAAQPYRASAFNTENVIRGYRNSTVRQNMLTDYINLAEAFPALDDITVASADTTPGEPESIPAVWQSQRFQSNSNNGISASPYAVTGTTYLRFNQNGLNSAADSPIGTGSTDSGANHATGTFIGDKMWLPSAFEVYYMGDEYEGSDRAVTMPGSIVTNETTLDRYHRTGLWRTNGYDRAHRGNYGSTGAFEGSQHDNAFHRTNCGGTGTSYRSGVITTITPNGGLNTDSLAIGRQDRIRTVRPAMHLDMAKIAELVEYWTNRAPHIEALTYELDIARAIPQYFTNTSWQDLQQAITAGEQAIARWEIQEMIDALEGVTTAIANLVPLEGAVEQIIKDLESGIVKARALNPNDYNEQTWQKFETIVNNADEVIDAGEEASLTELVRALGALNHASANLEEESELEKRELILDDIAAKITEIENEELVAANFTAQSWENLETAIAHAKAADIDIASVNLIAILTGLNAAYNDLEYAQLEESSDTDKTWKKYLIGGGVGFGIAVGASIPIFITLRRRSYF